MTVLFWFSGTFSTVAADECLRMGMIEEGNAHVRVSGPGKRIFKKAGLCADYVPAPVRRAEAMTIAGDLDGEMFRTAVWIKRHEDKVVGVPTPIFTDQMMALTLTKSATSIASFADLKGKRVAIIGGHRWAETRLGEIGVSPIKVSSVDQFMELLRVGRVEVGLLEESLLTDLGELSGMTLSPVSPLPYFMVLRREHADLVPILDEAIQWVQENPDE